MAVELASSEEQMLIEMVRDLAREQVAPRAAQIDAEGAFPWDMKELLAKQDILAMPFPEEYGGLGSSEVSILMTIEELAKACATTALILCVQQLGALPILLSGTAEQKQRFIPRLRAEGLGDVVDQIMIDNPARAFAFARHDSLPTGKEDPSL